MHVNSLKYCLIVEFNPENAIEILEYLWFEVSGARVSGGCSLSRRRQVARNCMLGSMETLQGKTFIEALT